MAENESKVVDRLPPDQRRVDDMMTRLAWPYWTPHEIIVQMTSELGELADVVNRDFGPKPAKPGDDADEETELGDLYYAVICYANSRGLSLELALGKSMEKFSTRDKDRYKEDGHDST